MPASSTHEYDVLVVGAGGAGLRAVIEAAARANLSWQDFVGAPEPADPSTSRRPPQRRGR